MTTTPKPYVSREKRLQRLGKMLNQYSPEDRAKGAEIAAKLLALKMQRKGADAKTQPLGATPPAKASNTATAAIHARRFLTQRHAESVKLAPVESMAAPAYGFDPIGWQVFVVLDDHLHVGGSEHIAVNTETGEVKSLGVLGD